MDKLHTDWQHHAACTGTDPELFFPTGDAGPARRQLERAKAVCRGCPVREQCLAWALATGQDHGVWGAASEEERRALRRRGAHHGGHTPRDPDPPTAASTAGRRHAARRELARGTRRTQVAAQVGVSVRTIDRWIAEWGSEPVHAPTAGAV